MFDHRVHRYKKRRKTVSAHGKTTDSINFRIRKRKAEKEQATQPMAFYRFVTIVARACHNCGEGVSQLW